MFALAALAARSLAQFGIPGFAALARRAAVPVVGGIAGAAVGGALFGDGDATPRRRRRRRVLTSNDRADISFITATLGAPAGKAFAMIVAARV